jgi:hypothetical protein
VNFFIQVAGRQGVGIVEGRIHNLTITKNVVYQQ